MKQHFFILFAAAMLPFMAACSDDGFLKPLREFSDKLAPEAAQKAEARQRAIAGVDNASFLQAVTTQKPEEIISMLEKGADPNARDEKGQTALIVYLTQTKYPDPETADAFLRAGADVNAVNEQGAPLVAAACAISPKMTQTVLAHGAKVDSVSENGMTPLMFCAISANSPESIQLLLQAGADPNYQAPNGWTALTVAQQYNRNPAVAQALQLQPMPMY